jgi:hypothetical protein
MAALENTKSTKKSLLRDGCPRKYKTHKKKPVGGWLPSGFCFSVCMAGIWGVLFVLRQTNSGKGSLKEGYLEASCFLVCAMIWDRSQDNVQGVFGFTIDG